MTDRKLLEHIKRCEGLPPIPLNTENLGDPTPEENNALHVKLGAYLGANETLDSVLAIVDEMRKDTHPLDYNSAALLAILRKKFEALKGGDKE